MSIFAHVPEGTTLRPVQIKVLSEVEANWNKYDCFVVPAMVGCHAAGERVLMYDGTVKYVEDVVIGDKLMGPDSKPRNVLKLCRGTDTMYKVTPVKGDPMIVNGEHILSFKMTPHKAGQEHVIKNMSVNEYLRLTNSATRSCKLWRTGVEFSNIKYILPIDPYILGIWLGDGSSSQTSITTMDAEVVEAWTTWCNSLGLVVREHIKDSGDNLAKTYSAVTQTFIDGGKATNAGAAALRDLGVLDNKHIPQQYLSASKEDRLNLLAGLLDTDGSLAHGGFDFIQKRKNIADGIAFLARSVGLAAYVSECRKGCQTGYVGTYYRVSISGHCDIIPTRVRHKKCGPRLQKKSALVTGFKVEKLGTDNYYGWKVDGDNLYLMHDFTVTHNSGKSVIAMTILQWRKSLKQIVSIVTPQVMLQEQYGADFPDVAVLKGKSRYECSESTDKVKYTCEDTHDMCENYCESCPYLAAKSKVDRDGAGVFNFHSFLFGSAEPDTLIVDEAHCIFDVLSDYYTKHMYKSQDNYGNVQTIGDAMIFLEKKLKDLRPQLAQLKKDKNPEDAKEIRQLSREIANLNTIIGGVQANPKEFFFERKDTEFRRQPTEEINIKPLDLGNLSAVLWPKKGKVVLMSGTINSLDIQKLGLGMRRVLTIDCPSAIDPGRRPVEFIPVANMSYKYQEVSVPIMAKYLLALLDKHPDEKGLIHVPYQLAVKLRPHLKHKRLMWHDNKDKEDAYKAFRATTQPAVLVASGMAEGVDLPYDAGRWQAIIKIQYPSLADNLMKYFMNSEPSWYSWLTIRTLVQQCGRICRGPDDYGVSYILDVAFENLLRYNKRLMPKYFLDALHIHKRPTK